MTPDTLTDRESEEQILGALIASPALIADVADALPAESFYFAENRALFALVVETWQQGEVSDLSAFQVAARATGKAGDIGGAERIGALALRTSATGSLRQHADRLRALYRARYAATAAQAMIRRLADPEDDADQAIAELSRALAETPDTADRMRLQLAKDLALAYVDELEKKNQAPHEQAGTPYGIPGIDSITGGKKPGRYTVIGARPGMGKTALVTTFLRQDMLAGIPAVLYSFEMTGTDSAGRLLSQESGVAFENLDRVNLSQGDWDNLFPAVERMTGWKLGFRSMAGATADQVARAMRADVARLGAQCVYVDYVQLIRGRAGQSRYERVTDASETLANCAKELGIHVVGAAQLGRDAQGRKPTVADLKESGQIEQDADLIIFPYRDTENHLTADEASIIIGKNRHGPGAGTEIPVKWHGATMRFSQAAPGFVDEF